MIHLCIDARMAHSSGIGTCIRNLVPLLHTFKITLLVQKKNEPWCAHLDQIVVDAPIYSIQEQLQLPFKIPSCDLFWSPHYNVPLLPIRAKKRLVTIHDACHLALSKYLSLPEKLYARFVMKRAYRTADAVITDSQFSKDELIRYLGQPKKHLSVIPLGLDQTRFQRSVNPQVRQKYSLPEKFILFVGNLKPHKNLSGLIQAFSFAKLPHHHLVLVGKAKGLRNAETLQGVQILEDVPDSDLAALYSLADLFILPSFYEGFGLPPLEAMSCGCPTLVSNIASLPEVCGDASAYLNPHNIEEMAHALKACVNDEVKKKELILKGYKQIELFQWHETAKKYGQLFEEIL